MSFVRRIGLGRVAYKLYHEPKGLLKKCAAEGPLNLWLSARGRAAMERAAYTLTPTPCGGPEAPTVTFLTGAKFWYQTAFCASTLLRYAGRPLRVMVLDDGTLTPNYVAALNRCLPGVGVVSSEQILRRLDAALPASKFPSLRARRLVYPHLRKLTDVHAGETGWKLVLDSDMLFYRRPEFMLDWLTAPDRPFYLVDCVTCYGYTAALMTELAGCVVPDRVNVGACGLLSDGVDWDRLEYWCRATLEREGTSYFQEQALTALVVAGRTAGVAPAVDYIVLPARSEVAAPRGVLHHYVAESKAWYFRFGWRQAIGNEYRRQP